MKKILIILLVNLILLSGCTNNTGSNNIVADNNLEENNISRDDTNKILDGSPIYRTIDEWKNRFSLEEYHENVELTEIPKNRPYAKCVNGTFVGNNINGVDIYKGIPYAMAPIGDLRFQRAKEVMPSDKIYDASYFGKSCMQALTDGEAASEYEKGEDCLRLNIWNNKKSESNDKKPVFVYIHGGGFNSGGSVDPLYDGYNFVYYNPDIIVITINYRVGAMGYIDLSSFEGGEDFKYSTANGTYDQIEALRWVKNNIENFGGDKDNITICGESAGGASVSILCAIDEAKGLFSKAIPMSGAVNLCITPEAAQKMTIAIKEGLGINSVKEIQDIPFEDLKNLWSQYFSTLFNHPIMDGVALPKDLYENYKNGNTSDINILQGHTSDEFRYYYTVFGCYKPLYDAVCNAIVDVYKGKIGSEFDDLYKRYKEVILDLGYKEEDVNRCFADDMSLAISNTYQAILHANAGGKGYSYTFDIPYDRKFDDFTLGAAHAVDCFYLFGNFNGLSANGTNEEVDASIRFQHMIANFCKTGDPSFDGIEWPEYNNDTRDKLIFGINDSIIVENPEKERVDIVLEMLEKSDSQYAPGLSSIINIVTENHPELFAEMLAQK